MISMHHHLEYEDNEVNRYFHYQSAESFRNQLTYLKKLSAQYNGNMKFKITLDDGLKSQLTAAKILGEFNLKGYFYYNSSTLIDKNVLNVHLVHILLKTLNTDLKKGLYKDLLRSTGSAFDFQEAKYIYRKQRSFDIDQKIKYLVNYVSTSGETDDILKFYYFMNNETSLSELNTLIYMDHRDLNQLCNSGHFVLPHGHTHKILGRMSFDELDNEFSKMLEAHSSFFKTQVDEFCVPYGSKGSWSPVCDHICKIYGIGHVILVDEVRSVLSNPDPCLRYYSRTDCCLLDEYVYV